MIERYFQVAVEAPLKGTLTYSPPIEPIPLVRGQSVQVPLGKRLVSGIVLGETNVKPEFDLKPIAQLMESRPPLPEVHVRWLEWLADYYLHPIGHVFALAFPPLEQKVGKRASKKRSLIPEVSGSAQPPQLTEGQLGVIEGIQDHSGFNVHLLHGVTGSGKTEVYLQLLHSVLERKQRGLVLVPEISLTPQLIQRFAERFGDQIAVIHSHLTPREKTDQWWAMASGEKSILIGARSALFCPIPNLGMIIVDEEHEPSFKQEEQLKYHARDAAIMLAKLHHIPIVLGSATPSVESWLHAKEGRYQLHSMPSRVADRPLPEISVIDLRQEKERRKDTPQHELPFWLSDGLHLELSVTLEKKEQAALFLNRRGIAQSAICLDCGHDFHCPNCAIALTVHGHNHLVCHYCDYTDRLPEHCPDCQSSEVKPLGLGTELVEKDIARLFPEARIARADRDEIQGREALEDLIFKVEKREIDILVGTQMIAKGLDFPGLNLVGLILADVGFHWPDFRASERSFQLLTQVAGRSGRHSAHPGKVVIQTYNPDHPAILYACQHDIQGFLDQELVTRQELFYPPYSRVAMIRIQGPTIDRAESATHRLLIRAQKLREERKTYHEVSLLGPAPAPLAKLRGKFRFHMLIKSASPSVLNHFCREVIGDETWIPASVQCAVDMNPVNML